MCRAGGRRCPSHLSDLARRARNAQRRAEYAKSKVKILDPILNKAVAESDHVLLHKTLDKIEKHQKNRKEAHHEAQWLHQKYIASVAENALISDAQEAAAARGESAQESAKSLGGSELQGSIAALPKVFGGEEYKGTSGDALFKDTDEITSVNPELGIYKTKNTGELAELRYFNKETIRGTIVKSKLTEESAHKDLGFRKIDRKAGAYEIVSFNDVGENRLFDANEAEEVISAAELNTLSIEEKSSLKHFTGSGYRSINEALYGDREDYFEDEEKAQVSKRLQGDISRIDSALEKGPKRQRYLYRSMTRQSDAMIGYSSAEEWVDANFSLGEDVVFDGYQSSSSEKSGFQDFAFHNGVVFEILTPEGANITSVSGYKKECETLLPRNARYKVVAVEKDVSVTFDTSVNYSYKDNTIVRLVAVNAKGEILDGTNSDDLPPVDYED